MDKKNKSLNKDAGVELARIIACLAVIGVHTFLPIYVGETFDIGRGFICCLIADGVAVFWMISGFYIFDNFNYLKILKKTVRTVIIPVIVVNAAYFYLARWILNGIPLIESLTHTKEEYLALLNSVISWNNPLSEFGHFWYLWVYVLLMICSPMIYSFIMYLNEKVLRRNIFFGVSAAFLLINDISNNNMAAFSHHSINALFPAMIEMVWGYFLYKSKTCFKSKKWICSSCALFLSFNIVRLAVQLIRNVKGTGGDSIYYWYSVLGLICAICILIFCFSLVETIIKSNVVRTVICCISSFTFPVYIFHLSVYYDVLNRFGIKEQIVNLLQSLCSSETSFLYECLYILVISIVVFTTTALIILGFRLLNGSIKRIGHFLKAKIT